MTTITAGTQVEYYTVEDIEGLVALPIGTEFNDIDGDPWEKVADDCYTSPKFVLAAWDARHFVEEECLPAVITNPEILGETEEHADFRVGQLVALTTDMFDWVAEPGTIGTVHGLMSPYVQVRFQDGLVFPLLASEIKRVSDLGIGDRVRVNGNCGYLTPAISAGAVGRIVGHAGARFRVAIESDNPFASNGTWGYYPSELELAEAEVIVAGTTITSERELDALPDGAVLLSQRDSHDYRVKVDGQWRRVGQDGVWDRSTEAHGRFFGFRVVALPA